MPTLNADSFDVIACDVVVVDAIVDLDTMSNVFGFVFRQDDGDDGEDSGDESSQDSDDDEADSEMKDPRADPDGAEDPWLVASGKRRNRGSRPASSDAKDVGPLSLQELASRFCSRSVAELSSEESPVVMFGKLSGKETAPEPATTQASSSWLMLNQDGKRDLESQKMMFGNINGNITDGASDERPSLELNLGDVRAQDQPVEGAVVHEDRRTKPETKKKKTDKGFTGNEKRTYDAEQNDAGVGESTRHARKNDKETQTCVAGMCRPTKVTMTQTDYGDVGMDLGVVVEAAGNFLKLTLRTQLGPASRGWSLPMRWADVVQEKMKTLKGKHTSIRSPEHRRQKQSRHLCQGT